MPSPAHTSLTARVAAARQDDERVLLEGVHALKHAVRFGAVVEVVASPDVAGLHDLLEGLAPELVLPVPVESVRAATWAGITGGGLPSPCLAIARRPADGLDAVLARRGRRPIVALEEPTHLGNVGAVVRVAAAADAAGVLVVGEADPWHPRAVRGGAGLQFAVPVGRRPAWPSSPRPVVAVDPEGDLSADLDDGTTLLRGAVLVFGSERRGLSDAILDRADHHLRLPMRAGVSSLNLATSVAAVLYGVVAPGGWDPDRRVLDPTRE